MDAAKKRKKGPSFFQRLTGYLLGLLCWTAGLHCLEKDGQGRLRIVPRRFVKHLFKLFMWALEIALVYHLMVMYCAWLYNATPGEKATAFLVKSVIFLYVKVFWPQVFPEILPGYHYFFCPQCYQKHAFRFQPVSFQFGFFVTYLCRHCFCLVNGWGEQIFYPLGVPFGATIPYLTKMLPAVLAVLASGALVFKFLWGLF